MVSRKLKDNSGASILLALLFFLLCALAGSVVLAAGSAAAGRMKDVNAKEQAYFSVTSAAELLKEEIEGKSISYDTVKDEWIQSPDSNLKDILKNGVKELLSESPDDIDKDFEEKLTITMPENSEWHKALGKVKAALYMKAGNTEYAKYTVVVTLSLKTNKDDDPNYTCTLTIPAAELNDGTSSGSDILSLVWSNAVITKGGAQ